VLDVEVALNNRPLSYLEEDIQLPVLTPNSMLHINLSYLPKLQPHYVPDKDLRKRAKFFLKCKEVMWKRWTAEYIRGLRESHRQAGGEQTPHLNSGDVVIIRDDNKNQNQWKLAVVTDLIRGRDGIVRGAKLRTSKDNLESAVQHLYPLELHCAQMPPRSRLLITNDGFNSFTLISWRAFKISSIKQSFTVKPFFNVQSYPIPEL